MRNVRAIFSAHNFGAVSAEASIELGGKLHRIVGRRTSFLNVALDCVALLTEDSTPQDRKLAPDAANHFTAAAAHLILEGEEFYTVLRPNWALPAFRWRNPVTN